MTPYFKIALVLLAACAASLVFGFYAALGVLALGAVCAGISMLYSARRARRLDMAADVHQQEVDADYDQLAAERVRRDQVQERASAEALCRVKYGLHHDGVEL